MVVAERSLLYTSKNRNWMHDNIRNKANSG